MKANFIKYMFIATILSVSFSSCDDFLDVNTDPNRVTAVQLEVLLPTTIESTSAAHYSSARQACQVTQQISSYFSYPEILAADGTWVTIYLKSMNNLDLMVTQAEKESSPHYAGVGKVLQAINLGLLTDHWEAVPYTQAIQGSDNFTPAYDSQESIYNAINSLLDDGISDLQAVESVFSPSEDGSDLAYGGDLEKWTKLAYTLKARYAMHLSNKGGAGAEALAALGKAMTSNDDDFQLEYNSVNKNPWHTNVALAINTGNLTVAPGSYLIDVMRSTADAGDPRLAAIADTVGTGASMYIGLNSFDEDAPTNNVNFSESTWHSTETAPILMSTYAETKFLEAEAALMTTDMDAAYAAYQAGIEASMAKLGVDGSVYMADAAVAVGADNLKLSDIMREKYIALYLNPESWVDMRRHHYDTAVYPGFEVPVVGDLTEAHQRLDYPTTEVDRNATNAMANEKPLSETMWRDQ